MTQIFAWFHEPPATRINFGAIYFPEPDETGTNTADNHRKQYFIVLFILYLGHQFGPISPEMNKTLQQCDDYIGLLLKMVDDDPFLKTNLNVILTSDHGMHEVEKSHRIILENYIDKNLFSAYGGRPLANIFVHKSRFSFSFCVIFHLISFFADEESDIDKIYNNLSKLNNYEVYRKSEIPDEYHYQKNIRIGGNY